MSISLATVSGVASTNATMLDWFARNTIASVVTTKSIQVEANPGNREPILTEASPGSFGNAVGLRNPGLEATVRELTALQNLRRRHPWPRGTVLNISLAGDTPEAFAHLARALAPLGEMLELNFSCPHARGHYGSAIGADPDAVEMYTRAVVRECGATPVYVKLTPNTDRIAEIAVRAVGAGAAGLVAINTADPQVYTEPHSGASILSNPPEGRGGKSGRWIRERAVECVTTVRQAVGGDLPIIGMGGVESHHQALALIEAGATVVGVGSALARVHQQQWPAFLEEIARGERKQPGEGYSLRGSAGMRFRPARVVHREELDERLFEVDIALEGDGASLEYRSGQVCFLWIPGVGEKPFSPAGSAPLRFLVARRGPFTEALGRMTPGERIFVRGPYGTPMPAGRTSPHNDNAVARGPAASVPPRALIIAGGSGMALLPSLVRELCAASFAVTALVGLRDGKTRQPLQRDTELYRLGTVSCVADEGTPGRVLDAIEPAVADRLYLIGPEPFMKEGLRRALAAGYRRDQVTVSLEQSMLCGVGLCGACHNRGILTCHSGTLVSAEQWEDK